MRALPRALIVLLCAIAGPALADPGDGPRAAAGAPEQQVLAVTLNTMARGDLFVLRAADGELLVRLDDLRGLGVRVPDGLAQPVDGEAYVALGAIPGLHYAVRSAQLTLDLQIDPALLPGSRISMVVPRQANIVRPDAPSAFFNYALQTTSPAGGARFSSLDTEAGIRLGSYLVESNASTSWQDGAPVHTVRLMSRATRDDVASLQRLTWGDFFTTAGELGSSANLGGIALSTQYGLDPYLVRQPMSSLRTQIALPSEVEVFVDGQRVRLDRVQPGELQLDNLYGYGGARDVQVLVRDAFGRVQQLDYSIYFSDQPLRQGLHEYSYGLGLLRRNFGVRSNDYGPPAFSAYHRYGWTDSVTLGLRAEGRREAYNAGASGTFVLGGAGVLGGAFAWSRANGTPGWAWSGSYTYQRRDFSVGVAVRRSSPAYATLSDSLVLFNRRHEVSVSAGYHIDGLGTVGVRRSILAVHRSVDPPPGFTVLPLQAQRVTSLSYSAPLVSGQASLTVSLNRVHDAVGARNEVMARITVFLDRDRSLQAGTFRSQGSDQVSVRMIQNVPTGEGLGYETEVSHASGAAAALRLRLASQLNTRVAVLRAEAERTRASGTDSQLSRLSLAGGVALIGGRAYLARPLSDSYALVETRPLAGVPVALNGLQMGATDAQGRLLVPNLNAYVDNELSIDQAAIPIEYAVPQIKLRLAPMYRSGVVASFQAARVQTISAFLVRQRGDRKEPLELATFSLRAGDKVIRSFTGRGGEIYLENLPAGDHTGHAEAAGQACDFVLRVPDSSDSFLQLGQADCR